MSLDTYPEVGYTAAEEGLDVRQFWAILRKRRATFFQIFVLVLVVGAAATVLSKPVYQTKAKLKVPAGRNEVNVLNPGDAVSALMKPGVPDSVSTQIQMIQSRPFIKQAIEKSGIHTPSGVVKPSIKVEAVKDTNIIQVIGEGGDPKEIATLVNTILDLHVDRTDSFRQTGYSKGLAFLEKQTKEANEALQEANAKLAAFRRDHPVAEMGAMQDSQQRSLMEAQSAVVAAQTNVSSTVGQIARIKARLNGMKDQIVKYRQVPNQQRALLQDKLRMARVERQDLLANYLPESDEVKAVDEKIANYTAAVEAEAPFISEPIYLSNPMRDALDKQLTELEANLYRHQENLNAANAQVRTTRSQLVASSPWKPEFDELTQAVERARTRYNSLFDKLQDMRIFGFSGDGSKAQVIENAGIPTVPIQPKPMMNIALAFVLGAALAVGVVFLQEYLDDRIHEPDDLMRLARLPSLGHVPAIGPGDAHLVSQLASDSHVSEAYRSVRSAIGFAGLDGPVRLIQITSASKGEGKSLTSANTAAAMAMDGKKVILVDSDMRRPSQHKVLTLPLSPGLSEVLVGQKTWQEVIHDGPVPNLRIICAGTMPPNPAELLGARSFVQLANDLLEQADVVIFDTPPCLPVTDPLIVASRMDAVILVISAGSTRRGAIRHVMGLLTRARARVVGAVFNRVDAKQGGYYYQYYKHYYGDGYYSDTDSSDTRRRNGKLPESVLSEEGVAVSSSKE